MISFAAPRLFNEPESWTPERWTTRPELVLPAGEKAFTPFLTGPYNCIGKHLALMEARVMIAKMVLNFDISFAEGEGDAGNGTALFEDSKENFTMTLGDLYLKFEKRMD